MRQHGIIIAIDGPTASGKSSTARAVASQLGYRHLNTGAMYRAFALYCKQWGVTDAKDKKIGGLLERVYIDIDEHANVLLDGSDVATELVAPDIASLASSLAARPDVRERMVSIQQDIGAAGGFVIDGRDIGTVVFPDAELKIFLIASPRVRADRRFRELASQGIVTDLSQLEKEIAERDKRDSERDISPLKQADDAVALDTSDLTFDEQVQRVVKLATGIVM
ncbi:MAG TPA: (d)CMP kinase [Candidatus Kapabacteria bacterium]|nr:(d)CMP kinase [Candidatus Kapabacteria bacterium]